MQASKNLTQFHRHIFVMAEYWDGIHKEKPTVFVHSGGQNQQNES